MDRIKLELKGARLCRLEIRRTADPKASALARRLAAIFESCGYHTRMLLDPDQTTEGVHLKSHPENAESALSIQSAFHGAGIDCLLSIDPLLSADVVSLQIGAHALAGT